MKTVGVLLLLLAPWALADPHLWLEEVQGEDALAWVEAQNEKALDSISTELRQTLEAELMDVLGSDERIPYVTKIGAWMYNLWRDADQPRGLWRRTSWESYLSGEPDWEPVLDLDALGQREGESWVWKGAVALKPEGTRVLLRLSRGGADAVTVREFDLATKAFVEGGFFVPEAKTSVSWHDENHIWVGTDFGDGSLTDSGYARTARLWRRGTPLTEAPLAFEGEAGDVSVSVTSDRTPGYLRDFAYRSTSFWTNEVYLRADGSWQRIDKPAGARIGVLRDRMYVQLRADWSVDKRTYTAGSLLVADFSEYLEGSRALTVLFEPDERRSLSSYSVTRDHVLLNVMEDVKSRVEVLTQGDGNIWRKTVPEGLPEFANLRSWAVDSDESNRYFVTAAGYLTPTTLYAGDTGRNNVRKVDELSALFDTTGLKVSQHFATSADGTRVPYFEISSGPEPSPTILYGYGGFEIPLTPGYSATLGAAWLSRGGRYVVANIRGGGEYGPKWHQAALLDQRPRAYEDMAAVAEDLLRRKVSIPSQLAVVGGSNGGLMVGNMLVSYPGLFAAAVARAPLLDMRRYHRLLAGASWMAEYGDPDDPEQWRFIQSYSPYQNVKSDADYPALLITTSTRDDRVHPGHGRKMAARMQAQGHDVLYFENTEGGHSGAADVKQSARVSAIVYAYLWQRLGQPAKPALSKTEQVQ